MNEFRDRTRDHYDGQAGHVLSRQERAQGLAAPLKRFHNAVKRDILHAFATGAASLLDIGTGRGGDLHKWECAKIAFVKGLDVSDKELQEARRRYDAMTEKGRYERIFESTQDLGIRVWTDRHGPYDVVSCMFAVHYFFGSEETAHTLLKFVAANLKDGGVFVGAVPDAKRVNAALVSQKNPNPVMRIEARWEGFPGAFGSQYMFALQDTVTQGFEQGSLEYLVYENVLQRVAAQYGLAPVLEWPVHSPRLTGHGLFKHFRPPYDGFLGEASLVFAAFAFRKST